MSSKEYIDYLNDVKMAICGENIDQTPESVDRLIHENISDKHKKIYQQHYANEVLVEQTQQMQDKLKRDKKRLNEQRKQFEQERIKFERTKQKLEEQQEQFFTEFLKEQVSNPVRVDDQIIVEHVSTDLERDHLLQQFKVIEQEREELKKERSELRKHLRKINEKTRELDYKISQAENNTVDGDSVHMHMEQLRSVMSKLQVYDPQVQMLPALVMKAIPAKYREQIIEAYDKVLIGLENVNDMSLDTAYKLIEQFNTQAVESGDSVQHVKPIEESDTTGEVFDYNAYRARLKKHHEQIAERHLAELTERPENAGLLESYEPSQANQSFFEAIQAAKQSEIDESSGGSDGDSDASKFHFNSDEFFNDTNKGSDYDTSTESPDITTGTGSGTGTDTGSGADTDTGSGADTDTGSGADTDTGSDIGTDTGTGTGTDTGSDTGTGSQPITSTDSTGSQPVTSFEDMFNETSITKTPRLVDYNYIQGQYYKHPEPRGNPPGRVEPKEKPTFPPDPWVHPSTYMIDPDLPQAPSDSYNQIRKGNEFFSERRDPYTDPYEGFSEANFLNNKTATPGSTGDDQPDCPQGWVPYQRRDGTWICTKAL